MGNRKGVALIITLLVAMVLFIAIITISSSLSVSSKRVTTDQKNALEAQYAAESGLSLAAAKVPSIGKEITSILEKDDALKMPSDTNWDDVVKEYVQYFCGEGVRLNPPDNTKHTICVADSSKIVWDSGKEPYKVLVDFVDREAYPTNPCTGDTYNPRKYWSERFGLHTTSNTVRSGDADSTYTVTFGYVPQEALADTDNSVHLIFKAEATSTGQVKKGSEPLAVRKVKQEFTGKLEIILRPPSFARYMSFTNYQRTPSGKRVYFFDQTYFDGPVHTNEHFNFIGKPWFGDEVTSAGCLREDRRKEHCVESYPGFYYWDSDIRKSVLTPAPPDSVPPYAEPIYTKPPKWNADYIPLPKGGDAQKRAAMEGGLYIEDKWDDVGDYNVNNIVLSIGKEGGKEYQYIQVWGKRMDERIEIPGKCVKNSSGGGGGGGGSEEEGPAVEIMPELPARIFAQLGAPWSLPRLAGKSAQYVQELRDIAGERCPPGEHWRPPYYKKVGHTEVHNYRVDANGVMEELVEGAWVVYRENFNGVIYSGWFDLTGAGNEGQPDGGSAMETNDPRFKVDSRSECPYTYTEWDGQGYCIEPSIAKFTQLTIAGHQIQITRDITYEERPCASSPEVDEDGTVKPAVCDNLDAENILGVYADTGSIVIWSKAPPNMYLDAVLMSGKKSVYYSKWNKSVPRGELNLTGGIIQNYYGRFGQLNPDLTIKNGYGRKFTYDRRMHDSGLTPPYFPTFDKGTWKGEAEFEGTGGGNGFWMPVEGN